MSRRALAQGIVTVLTDAGFDPCGLAPLGGKPPPGWPGKNGYVGVYCGGRTNETPAAGLKETYSAVCVVSWRIAGTPFDRVGPELAKAASDGFDDFVDRVRLTLAMDLADGRVQAAANAVLGYDRADTTTPNPFTTALLWLGDDDPQPVDARWFGAQGKGNMAVGVVTRLRFGGMKRVQDFFGDRPVT